MVVYGAGAVGGVVGARLAQAGHDVVLLAMKSNDTVAALEALAATVAEPATIAVVCLQNGVANERAALRRFPDVYGISVMCPTAHLKPGVVQVFPTPIEGVLDIGRCPPRRSTAPTGRAGRPGRAWPAARARSRWTTSTARSCCWDGSTGCRHR